MKKPDKIVITQRILITLYRGHLPIAWGHLEPEGGKTWLAVSVAEGYGKQNNGNVIVKNLCSYADNAGWDLWLTCKPELRDWYEKFGFEVECFKKVFYMYRKNRS